MGKIKNTFQNITKMLSRSSIIHYTTTNLSGYDDDRESRLQVSWKDSLYLTTGLLRIKDAVSSIDFELYKILNTKGEAERIEAHPILDLLYKPNPLQTKSEFWRILVVNFKLSGEAFIRIVRNEISEPIMLLNILPAEMKVEIIDGKVKYTHSTNGKEIFFNSEEIIHIKDPDINDQLRGNSVLRAVFNRVQAEINASTYQNGAFARNGMPDGLLVAKTQTDGDVLKQMKRAFLNSFTGTNDTNRTAVLGGDITYQQLSSTNTKELDYINSQKAIRDDIMLALGVPKSLITTDDVNKANADAGLEQFMKFTIAPMVKLILEVLNERFVIPNYGEELYLDTQKLIIENKEDLLKELSAGVNKWLTVNEARQRSGYEPIEGGDVLNTQNTYGQNLPVFANAFKSRKSLFAKYKMIEDIQIKSKKDIYLKTIVSPIFKAHFNNAMNSVRQKGQNRIKKETKNFLNEQLNRVIKKVEDKSFENISADSIFDRQIEKEEVKGYILPLFSKTSTEAGNMALTPLKLITEKASRFVLNSVLFKQLEDRADFVADSINNTTYLKVAEIVSANMHLGIPTVAEAIKELYSVMSDERALTIARTEAGYITSLGTQMAYEQSDVVEGKIWLTSLDDRVRDEHQLNEGEIVGKGEVFPNGEAFPAELTINCRCTIAPVIK